MDAIAAVPEWKTPRFQQDKITSNKKQVVSDDDKIISFHKAVYNEQGETVILDVLEGCSGSGSKWYLKCPIEIGLSSLYLSYLHGWKLQAVS